jgi:hypothetical protein
VFTRSPAELPAQSAMTDSNDDAPPLSKESMLAAVEVARRIVDAHARLRSADPRTRELARAVLHAHVLDFGSVIRDAGSPWQPLLETALATSQLSTSDCESDGPVNNTN